MKRKQIIVLGLVLVIIAVGILQYNSGGTGQFLKQANADTNDAVGSAQQEEVPGAAVYVNGDEKTQADQTVASGTDTAAAGTDTVSTGEGGFFAQARLDRDKSRSKQKEELKSLSENGDPANPATLDAQQELVDVINRCDTENTMESLIKQSGFDDAIVYMSDTGNVDVVVRASSLSSQEVAKISDIVIRHSDVPMENITVKNVD